MALPDFSVRSHEFARGFVRRSPISPATIIMKLPEFEAKVLVTSDRTTLSNLQHTNLQLARSQKDYGLVIQHYSLWRSRRFSNPLNQDEGKPSSVAETLRLTSDQNPKLEWCSNSPSAFSTDCTLLSES